jgi:choline dehydrogenase-like flavoprotein
VVAKELATAGFRVVVLEQGPWLHEKDFQHDELWANQRHALTNDHRRQPNTRRETEAERATVRPAIRYGRMVGGGTVHFTANYWRFHEIDFVERSRKGAVPGTGFDDWPITYADLEPYYTKAEWELGVSGQAGASPRDPPRSRPYPLPPLPIKPIGVLAERAARKLGWTASLRRWRSSPSHARGRACVHCGFCEGSAARRGREEHARERDSGRRAHRSMRDPPGLRPPDRGGPPRARNRRRLLRPRGRSTCSGPAPSWSAPAAPRRRAPAHVHLEPFPRRLANSAGSSAT